MGRMKRHDGTKWIDVAPSAQEFDAHQAETAIHTTQTEKDKLAGIEAGAEVNRVTSVNGEIGDVVVESGLSESEVDSKLSKHATNDSSHGLRGYSVTLGYNSSSSGSQTVTLGSGAITEGNYAVAIGRNAHAENGLEGILGDTGSAPRLWKVPGDFSVSGSKNFEIPHPHPNKKSTHRIRHGAVESPTEGDTLYRYEVEATIDGETVVMQLPDYFRHLNKNVDVWVNGVKHFGRAYADVDGDLLKVTCEKAGRYRCLVIGTRNDDNVQDWQIKGVEREIGESWTGETYVFSDDEIISEDEYIEEDVA